MLMVFSCGIAFAQDEAAAGNDSTALPVIEYGSMPRKYEIADISISGADNYEDFVLIGYSGLEVGQVIEIPGNAITDATKKFWRQGLFSDVVIRLTKVYGDKAWLEIQLKQQPRISQINYHGLKKSEREDLETRLGLVKGNQITPNIVDRATSIIKKHFEEKGFKLKTDRGSNPLHKLIDLSRIKECFFRFCGNPSPAEQNIIKESAKQRHIDKVI